METYRMRAIKHISSIIYENLDNENRRINYYKLDESKSDGYLKLVIFSDIEERRRYESLEIKEEYSTSSAAILMPLISVEELVRLNDSNTGAVAEYTLDRIKKNIMKR